MQSKCTCKSAEQQQQQQQQSQPQQQQPTNQKVEKDLDKEPVELCNVCRYHRFLPQLHSMPDMLFNNNLLRLEHCTGVGIEFNPLDALKLVEATQDPLRVAVADGWQSARADCPFAKSVVKPFDWTFTTNYKGTLLSAIKKSRTTKFVNRSQQNYNSERHHLHHHHHHHHPQQNESQQQSNEQQQEQQKDEGTCNNNHQGQQEQHLDPKERTPTLTAFQNSEDDRLCLTIEETDERIDVNRLKVREEILFYDDVTLYEDELADHGTAQYSVKIRVMPSSLFILARYYLRVDGVLARINDVRIYHEKNKRYLLREYTNREARLSNLNLPVSTVINPNELMSHLPLIHSSYEKLTLPKLK